MPLWSLRKRKSEMGWVSVIEGTGRDRQCERERERGTDGRLPCPNYVSFQCGRERYQANSNVPSH